ncbi:hypothetical protein KPB2_5345 [Klebsiella pneumoniae Kb677]|nr:hypothetical protein KPB2_5345 [Klebsiella pneumoniae Kb677]
MVISTSPLEDAAGVASVSRNDLYGVPICSGCDGGRKTAPIRLLVSRASASRVCRVGLPLGLSTGPVLRVGGRVCLGPAKSRILTPDVAFPSRTGVTAGRAFACRDAKTKDTPTRASVVGVREQTPGQLSCTRGLVGIGSGRERKRRHCGLFSGRPMSPMRMGEAERPTASTNENGMGGDKTKERPLVLVGV